MIRLFISYETNIQITNPMVLLSNSITAENRSFSDYSALQWYLRRSQYLPKDESKQIGDKIKLKTEFYNYSNNLIVVCEKDNSPAFLIISDGIIKCISKELNDNRLLYAFEANSDVVDSLGRRLNISNLDSLRGYVEFYNIHKAETKSMRSKYNDYLRQLLELKEKADCYPNANPSDCFEDCYELAIRYANELRNGLLLQKLKVTKQKEYVIKPTKERQMATLFGLYLSCVKSFEKQKDEQEKYSVCDTAISLMKEFRLFILRNPGIFKIYNKEFDVKKCERTAINKLLRRNNILDKEWRGDEAELII